MPLESRRPDDAELTQASCAAFCIWLVRRVRGQRRRVLPTWSRIVQRVIASYVSHLGRCNVGSRSHHITSQYPEPSQASIARRNVFDMMRSYGLQNKYDTEVCSRKRALRCPPQDLVTGACWASDPDMNENKHEIGTLERKTRKVKRSKPCRPSNVYMIRPNATNPCPTPRNAFARGMAPALYKTLARLWRAA